MGGLARLGTGTLLEVRFSHRSFFLDGSDEMRPAAAAAFLEFHAPLAAWIHPGVRGPSGDDTLLASGQVYNNFVRMDVWYKAPSAT